MKKNFIAALALTFVGSASMASTLQCTVSEVIAGSLFRKTVTVAEESTEFVKTIAGTSKGFIAYSGGHAVINFTDISTDKTSYTVQNVEEGRIATLVVRVTESAPATLEVICSAHN